jgi:hypothetical protein
MKIHPSKRIFGSLMAHQNGTFGKCSWNAAVFVIIESKKWSFYEIL